MHPRPLALPSASGNLLRGTIAGEADAAVIVLFLHGFRSDCGGQKATALRETALARGAQFACIDLSGHGQSGGHFRDFRLSTLFDDVVTVVQHLATSATGHPRLIVAGSSMGGWLATLAAQRHPQRIRGLLLLAPAFNFIQRHFGALPAATLRAWQRTGVRRFDSDYGLGQYELDYRVIADAARFDLLATPQTLACPCFIVHGAHDEAVPVAVSQNFFDRLNAPQKRLEIVADGDHRLHRGLGVAKNLLQALIDG